MIKETLRYGYTKNISIGDLFNGILSIVALNNRDTSNQKKLEIYVPEDRSEIIKFFSEYAVTRAENWDQNFLGLHVMDFMPNKSSYYFWNYFTGRNLQAQDLEISYLFDGKVSNLVKEALNNPRKSES